MKRLVAIGFIWVGCAVAWVILGTTIDFRTGDSSSALRSEVHALWGPPVTLAAPTASWTRVTRIKQLVERYNKAGDPVQVLVEETKQEELPLPLMSTDASATLNLEQRQKGLLWFPTYAIAFRGTYAFEFTGEKAMPVRVVLPIPSENAGLDGFQVLDGAGKPVAYEISPGGASWTSRFAPGERQAFQVAFSTRGTSSWTYQLAPGGTGQIRDFKLAVHTDFDEVDFPAGSISPTHHAKQGGGWTGEWSFKSLISSANVGLELPQRLNPGVVASRITFFAPVGLLFFFFVVSILAAAQGKNLHPLNYFFLALAFFAFHLLFAYLVDHVALLPSFAIASLVASALVVTYARWFVGWKFSLRELGLSQLLYLVLFSFTFFWNGFTGLAITVGAILTLFAMMQVTGKLDWTKLSQPQSPPPAPPSTPVGSGMPIATELAGVVEAFAVPPQARG